MLKEGTVVAGRYCLDSLLGEGAMGAVWKAHDETLRRSVAIKMLFVRLGRDNEATVEQFLREARIAASVQHRNVIQTVDFGIHEETLPFMVMELLNGESLEERMERQPPSATEFVQIASLTLRGLAAVHDAGIVHRDLKPANIFLQREPEGVFPKILDFGISRSLEGPSAITTQEGLIVGTPDYMSPEQARGEADIDRRSDIYSMGVILYQGLSGQLPFNADTVGELIVQIVTQEARPLREVAPDVPPILSDVVAQAMAPNREHRFVDARVMRTALGGAIQHAAKKARTQGRSGAAPQAVPPSDAHIPLPKPAAPAPPPPVVSAPPQTSKGPPPPLSLGAPPPPMQLSGAGGWGNFGGSLPPPSPLSSPDVSRGPDAAGSDFVMRDPYDDTAAGIPLGEADDRLSLDPSPRSAPHAMPTSGRPSFGGASLPGEPLGGRPDPTGRLELDYDRGTDPTSAGHRRPPRQGQRRPRQAAPQPLRRRRRRSQVPMILAVIALLATLYAPRLLLDDPPPAHAEPENTVRAAPGSHYQATRRDAPGKHEPALRDVLF